MAEPVSPDKADALAAQVVADPVKAQAESISMLVAAPDNSDSRKLHSLLKSKSGYPIGSHFLRCREVRRLFGTLLPRIHDGPVSFKANSIYPNEALRMPRVEISLDLHGCKILIIKR